MMNSKLSNGLNDAQKFALEEVCRKFTAYPAEVAFKYLWNLTYKPRYALEKMGLEDEEFFKYYRKVRNYILEQSGHEDCVGTKEAYSADLFTALGQDRFAAKRIVAAIDDACLNYPITELERIQKLLSSQETNCQFGGLRSLHLNYDEVNYFIPKVSAISQCFTEVLDEIKRNCGITGETPENYYATKNEELPNAEQSSATANTPVNESECDTVESEKETVVGVIMENKDLIESFLWQGRAAAYANNWDTDYILDHREVMKMALDILTLWKKIEKELVDIDKIIDCPTTLRSRAVFLGDIEALEKAGLNPKWIWENKSAVESLFTGFKGALMS